MIESITKNLKAKKIPGTDEFAGEFYQTFKAEWTGIFLSQTLLKGRRSPNSFYEATVTIPKPEGDTRKTTDQYPLWDWHKNAQQNSLGWVLQKRKQKHKQKITSVLKMWGNHMGYSTLSLLGCFLKRSPV